MLLYACASVLHMLMQIVGWQVGGQTIYVSAAHIKACMPRLDG